MWPFILKRRNAASFEFLDDLGRDACRHLLVVVELHGEIGPALVPLSNMFGYVNQLRSGTQGRANFTMQFDHYEQVPNSIASEIIEKFK